MLQHSGYSGAQLAAALRAERAQLSRLVAALPADAWLGPYHEWLNPPQWELGHIVWFQEHWCLRWQDGAARHASAYPQADAWFNSAQIDHRQRWQLALPAPAALQVWAQTVLDAVDTALADADDERRYFAELALYHEAMHREAWYMNWQLLGRVVPEPPLPAASTSASADWLNCPAGAVELGARPGRGFCFDNEKWAHAVTVPAFAIRSAALTEAEFAEFVRAGGYQQPALWSADGWRWRQQTGAEMPLYWRRDGDHFHIRQYQQGRPLRADAVLWYISAHEAEACARFYRARLPTAAEWQAATAQPGFRWGDCWEWLADDFKPYPGFAPDPYREYSAPWFGDHRELRGGSPVSHAGLRRPTFRNFYRPARRDVMAGFRLCVTA